MAVIYRNTEKCRTIEGNNDISSIKNINICIRHDEAVSATVEIYPEEVFVEVDRMYTLINGVKYMLTRVDEEGDAECTQDS